MHRIPFLKMNYREFLETKIELATESGFIVDPAELNPALKPHQRDAVAWALKGGRRALFESFGLGKTVQELEFCRQAIRHEGFRALIVCPLGVKQEFQRDAVQVLGYGKPEYVKTMQEVFDSQAEILLTNYERVRDGDIDPLYFTAVCLDEASVLRSFGSKTYQTFLEKFKSVPYKLVATATPSPNRYKELIHYAGYLEVMDTGQTLTRFFQRDSTKANNLTLYPNMEDEFWLWVSSWALFITKPSDLNPEYSDQGYDLPPLDVRWHEIPVHYGDTADRNGQMQLFTEAAAGLKEAAQVKRDSINRRIKEVERLILEHGNEQRREEGILQEMVCRAQGRSACKAESEKPQELHGKSREIQAKKPEMERKKSGKIQGINKEILGFQQRDCEEEEPEVVRGKQGEGENTDKKEKIAELWNNRGRISTDGQEAGLQVRDMPKEIDNRRNRQNGIYRSLPQDGEGERTSLHEMQFNVGNGRRQHRNTSKCNKLPKQAVIWCDLNDEQNAIMRMLKENGISYISLTGSDSIEKREAEIMSWRDREKEVFLTKAGMYGQGVNLQQSNVMIFSGISYKFEELIQAIHREYRYGQKDTVVIDIIYMENERQIKEALLEKWKNHDYMVQRMTDIVKKYGLNTAGKTRQLERKMGVETVRIEGQRYTAVHDDCVEETRRMAGDSVGLIHTSIPFGNHYEYSANYNDFGHNQNTEKFFEQMDFLTPELFRILKPGRVAAIHVKDRVLFGNATGTGMPTVEPFHALCIEHYMKHGFQYFGMITVVTDVVRENNQTYRLGWTEQCKDGSKMGVGCPEYILLFRKLPTDRSTAYADEPVRKSKEDYTRAQWQIDAHGYWRSSGDRLVGKEELRDVPVESLQKVYRQYSRGNVYSYEDHVRLAKELDQDGRLPATFMVVAPGSWNQLEVWDDINRMRTLNTSQSRRRAQMHVCPLQLDIVERIITRYSNEGDLVLDPFGGLMTVPMMAIKMGRRGYGIELNPDYFRDGVGYLQAAEDEMDEPTLFDFLGVTG